MAARPDTALGTGSPAAAAEGNHQEPGAPREPGAHLAAQQLQAVPEEVVRQRAGLHACTCRSACTYMASSCLPMDDVAACVLQNMQHTAAGPLLARCNCVHCAAPGSH